MEIISPFLELGDLKTILEIGTVLGGLASGFGSWWKQRNEAKNRTSLIKGQLLAKLSLEDVPEQHRKEAEHLYKELTAASPAAERVISRLVAFSFVFVALLLVVAFIVIYNLTDWNVFLSAFLLVILLSRPFRTLWNRFRRALSSGHHSPLLKIIGISISAWNLTSQYLNGIAFIQEQEELAMARRIDDALAKARNAASQEKR